ncbi:transketolase C-terminal domain-containing protein [Pyrobaculum neutrophilum]|uniref:2-oxoacid oxidoreductase (ferredoxin) n=1 Tax=Pyrobaculum neutrophilum (strain DSM 2338 / JCM 9278 / NBRC 100436 / V24Sta) TaxID=444157 RepID=B1YB14_PYRNV|nr:transketolase C-terminal domain-containing protein [Pyrobaculum neutrophilum]ACB40714.1 pyruvate flavodoxin/ferredoxin oxidoreductase domain protein [Pyrobaculum neutrophilum V24Sta]
MTAQALVPREKKIAQKRIALTGNHAVALAVKMCRPEVIAAYPITPQTPVVEKLAEYVNNGELDAEYIPVESEHSAMSASIGASAMGARTFTETSSQGLMHMYENLPIAVGLRLPIVMGVAARTISAPINVWGDYSDVMTMRELGWIIYIVQNAQEAFDTIIQAYRVAEDQRVHLPAVVAYDGFWTSHVLQPLDVPEDEEDVMRFAPITRSWVKLDVDNPLQLGAVGTPEWYWEVRWQAAEALRESLKVVEEVDREFGKWFGRSYGLFHTYRLEDAELAIVTYGSIYGLVKKVVDRLREEGVKAGALRLRVIRPWPGHQLRKALDRVDKVFVIDRAINHGGPLIGPMATEVAATLQRPVYNALATIGMRAIDSDMIYEAALKVAKGLWAPNQTYTIGLRGGYE